MKNIEGMKVGDTVKVIGHRGNWQLAKVVAINPMDEEWFRLISRWIPNPSYMGEFMAEVAIGQDLYNQRNDEYIKRGSMKPATGPVVQRFAIGELEIIWRTGEAMPENRLELRRYRTEGGEVGIGYYFDSLIHDAVSGKKKLIRYLPDEDAWLVEEGWV